MMPNFHFNTGSAGYLPLVNPWPSFGGALYAGYMLGHRYAEFAAAWDARTIGAGFDWSGNARHLTAFGALAPNVTDFGATALVTSNEASTPFDIATLHSVSGAFTFVALARTVATARTVALVRSSTALADPSTGLTLFPQTPQIRASAVAGATGNAQATLTNEIDSVALYAGCFASGQRTVFSRAGTGATKVATNTVSLSSLSAANPIQIGDEAGSGSGETNIYGVAFYSRAITQAEFDTIFSTARAFNDAVGVTGITV